MARHRFRGTPAAVAAALGGVLLIGPLLTSAGRVGPGEMEAATELQVEQQGVQRVRLRRSCHFESGQRVVVCQLRKEAGATAPRVVAQARQLA